MRRETTPGHPRCVALIKAMKAADLKAYQLASRMGIRPQSIAQLIEGRRTPSLDWLAEASRHIGCKPSALDPWLADAVPACVPLPAMRRVKVVERGRGLIFEGKIWGPGEAFECHPLKVDHLIGLGYVVEIVDEAKPLPAGKTVRGRKHRL